MLGGERSAERRAGAALAAIVLASLALKVALAVASADQKLFGDERHYLDLGRWMAEGRVYPTFWAPGQPFFLSLHHRLFGEDAAAAARLTQCLLSTLSVLFVHRAAAALLRPAEAVLAAALFAFEPTLIAFTHYLWSETLYLFLVTAALAALVP